MNENKPFSVFMETGAFQALHLSLPVFRKKSGSEIDGEKFICSWASVEL